MQTHPFIDKRKRPRWREGRGGRQEVLWERTKREKKKKKEGGEDGRGCEENARSGEKRRDEVKHRWPEEEGRCRCSRERERKEKEKVSAEKIDSAKTIT